MDDEQAPAAPAGWFATDDGRERYWDGERWTDAFRAPERAADEGGDPRFRRSPAGLLGGGAVLLAIGYAVSEGAKSSSLDGSDGNAGALFYFLGGVLILIGIIAYGVRIGRGN